MKTTVMADEVGRLFEVEISEIEISEIDPAPIEEARDLDRRLNAATDPAEMRALIARRRLVRRGMEFDAAMAEFERSNPVGPIRDGFPSRLG
jgi:hypothetical protein